MTPRGQAWAALALALLGLGGCALTGAPYLPSPPEAQQAPQETGTPVVRALEGQPRGLLLEVSAPADPEARRRAQALTLVRQEQLPQQAPGALAQRYVFTPQQHSALWDGQPLRFLDGELVPGASYRYLLVAVEEDQLKARSQVVQVQWAQAPPPPTQLSAQATGEHILLSWPAGSPRQGAVIFRRRLGEASWRRLGEPLPAGQRRFVDVPPEAGQVYGYLVSSVIWSQGVPLLGPPAPEVFVESSPPVDRP